MGIGEAGVLHAQLLGLAQLGARRLPGHHIGGLFGHGAGRLAPPGLDHLAGLVPGEFLQRPGEDKGHAGKPLVTPLLRRRHVDAGLPQPLDQVPALGACHPVQDAPCGDFPNVVHGGELLQGGVLQVFQRLEPCGQDLARLLPHLTDTEGVNQPGQVLLLGLFQGGQQLVGGALAHPVQLGNVLLL